MNVLDCIKKLSVDLDKLKSAGTASSEFTLIRKAFLRKAIETHPDKNGGVNDRFQQVYDAFEAIKEVSNSGEHDILSILDHEVRGSAPRVAAARPFDYYEAAAAAMPSYRFERAKNSRSKCVSCKEVIGEGKMRIGSMVPESGTFGRWKHLANGCFSVPNSIQVSVDSDNAANVADDLRAADEITICGICKLDDAEVEEIARFVADKTNWAKTTAAGATAAQRAKAKLVSAQDIDLGLVAESTAISQVSPAVKAPMDAKENSLEGKSFVLTGTFPTGGGLGLAAGKDGLKNMIELAGGSVKSSVSKKTDFLVASTTDAGASKVSKATSLGVKVIDLDALVELLRGETEVANAEIKGFSRGFGSNGRALTMSGEKLQELKDKASGLLLTAPVEEATVVTGKRVREEPYVEDCSAKRVETNITVNVTVNL
jgi:curved DNA-binding protein CbpA